MNRWLTLGLLLVASGALFLRSFGLDRRPMHGDEAVNAIKFGQLWDKGFYRYDPHEFHGPVLPYATAALSRLTAAPAFKQFSEGRLRWAVVVFGLGLILLLPLIADGLGKTGVLWAAALTAVSPAMVFYSRYYIHEMLLVFFTFLAIAAGWRYWRTQRLGWALLAGGAIGLMQATKETFAITLFAAGATLAIGWIVSRVSCRKAEPAKPALNARHLAAGACVWLATYLVLFSSFFCNADGLLDAFRTYAPWLGRAGGDSPHIHGWGFYFERLLWFQAGNGPLWTEALICGLAVVGASAGFLRQPNGFNPAFVRFLAIYTLALAAIYSLLPYKTPWCMLSFWHGAILLAGVGAGVLVQRAKKLSWKIAFCMLLLAGVGHLGWQAKQASEGYAADQRNPYVYAHTSADILKLIAQLEGLAKASLQGRQTTIKVVAPEDDYWPLPWYLRQFENVGWWSKLPSDPFAPVMIVSSKLDAGLDKERTHLMTGYFALRPQVFVELYVEVELWKKYLALLPPQAKSED